MYQNQSGKARSVVSAGLCICIACICTVQKRVDALELTSSEPGDSWSSTTVKAEPTRVVGLEENEYNRPDWSTAVT